jgi:hypothetical protein
MLSIIDACGKRFVHRITRLRQRLFKIVSLRNHFREIAAGHDVTAFLCRLEPDRIS